MLAGPMCDQFWFWSCAVLDFEEFHFSLRTETKLLMCKGNLDHMGTKSEKGEFSSRLYLIFEFLQSTG